MIASVLAQVRGVAARRAASSLPGVRSDDDHAARGVADDRRIRLLMCTNGTAERDGTRRSYGLKVPAHVSDPVEAAAWTAGLSKDQYAQMARRT